LAWIRLCLITSIKVCTKTESQKILKTKRRFNSFLKSKFKRKLIKLRNKIESKFKFVNQKFNKSNLYFF
jgi:hypothetical protein